MTQVLQSCLTCLLPAAENQNGGAADSCMPAYSLPPPPPPPGGGSKQTHLYIAKQLAHAPVRECIEGMRYYQTRRVVVCRPSANPPTGACPDCFAIIKSCMLRSYCLSYHNILSEKEYAPAAGDDAGPADGAWPTPAPSGLAGQAPGWRTPWAHVQEPLGLKHWLLQTWRLPLTRSGSQQQC